MVFLKINGRKRVRTRMQISRLPALGTLKFLKADVFIKVKRKNQLKLYNIFPINHNVSVYVWPNFKMGVKQKRSSQ